MRKLILHRHRSGISVDYSSATDLWSAAEGQMFPESLWRFRSQFALPVNFHTKHKIAHPARRMIIWLNQNKSKIVLLPKKAPLDYLPNRKRYLFENAVASQFETAAKLMELALLRGSGRNQNPKFIGPTGLVRSLWWDFRTLHANSRYFAGAKRQSGLRPTGFVPSTQVSRRQNLTAHYLSGKWANRWRCFYCWIYRENLTGRTKNCVILGYIWRMDTIVSHY
jgi:hypothetical protein